MILTKNIGSGTAIVVILKSTLLNCGHLPKLENCLSAMLQKNHVCVNTHIAIRIVISARGCLWLKPSGYYNAIASPQIQYGGPWDRVPAAPHAHSGQVKNYYAENRTD